MEVEQMNIKVLKERYVTELQAMVESDREGGVYYYVTYKGNGKGYEEYNCTCKGNKYHGVKCKHIKCLIEECV